MKGIMKDIVIFCLFIVGEYVIERDIKQAEIIGKMK